jgi:ketosteroid isomerase-like protein
MTGDADPLAADRHFFAALLAAQTKDLDQLLAEDFMLIDVMAGAEIAKPAFLEAIGARQLEFQMIEPAEQRVRRYGETAIVTGRTRMAGKFADEPFAASSRYTHVFVEHQGRWRLVAAQGTQIAPAA